MMWVDSRVGSGPLAKFLADLGIPIELTHLEYGDMAFLGTGPEGCPTPVGIERKTLSDFISSCRTERLQGHQLPGLVQSYAQVWVVIEGLWRPDLKTGLVLVPKGKKQWGVLDVGGEVSYRELMGRVVTLRSKAGVQVEWTRGKVETGLFLRTLYHWWVTAGWDAHQSHLGFPDLTDHALLVKYDRDNPKHLVKLMAKELHGVGLKKASAVGLHFDSPYAMVQASEKDWTQIDGVGKTMAKRIRKAMGVPE